KTAGAKFAGPVAIHHDNFAMWNSALTKWNSVKMGPHKDIVGALEKEIKAQHLYFMTSFHHAFAWTYYQDAFNYDAKDTAYAGLYTMPHKADAAPSADFQKLWLAKIKEVVKTYKPSLIWFDMDFDQNLPDTAQKKLFEFYYNWAQKNNIQAVVSHKSSAIHKYTGILDFERGKEDAITPYPWLTDDSMKGDSWFYQKSDTSWKSANDLICLLSDIVSKNGNLLLNVDPMADGTFPERTVDVLEHVGKWLKMNGESIYNSRPWIKYGEGAETAAQSVRYTKSKNNKKVYVIVLNSLSKPQNVISLKSFTKGKQMIKSIDIIQPAAKANWKWNDGHLEIEMPDLLFKTGDVRAVAFRINLQ
ncbi:MAG: alpha-L-fucosidase, partial [Chitinophagaceae bacterium]